MVVVIWWIIIESYEIVLPYGTDENSLVVGILSATLGFLLSLNLSQYLAQNKDGIGNFEAYVGQISALDWSVSTLEDPDNKRIEDNVIDNDVLVSTESHPANYATLNALQRVPFSLCKSFVRMPFNKKNTLYKYSI